MVMKTQNALLYSFECSRAFRIRGSVERIGGTVRSHLQRPLQEAARGLVRLVRAGDVVGSEVAAAVDELLADEGWGVSLRERSDPLFEGGAPLAEQTLSLGLCPREAECAPGAAVVGLVLAKELADGVHLRHRFEHALHDLPGFGDRSHRLQKDHLLLHGVHLAFLERVGSAIEDDAHGVEPVAEGAHRALPELRGVLPPEVHRVVLPDHVARLAGEGIGAVRLEGDPPHDLHAVEQVLLKLRACSEVAAHPPALDGDVAAALREEPVDHLHHERDAFDVHLPAPIAHVARGHEGVEDVELAHIFHVHAERCRDGHDELVPPLRLLLVMWVDGEVAGVHLAHQLLHLVQHRNFHGAVLHRTAAEAAVHLQEASEGVPEVLTPRDRAALGDVVMGARLVVVAYPHTPDGELITSEHGEDVVAGVDGAELIVLSDGRTRAGVALHRAVGRNAGEIETVDCGQNAPSCGKNSRLMETAVNDAVPYASSIFRLTSTRNLATICAFFIYPYAIAVISKLTLKGSSSSFAPCIKATTGCSLCKM